MEKAFGYLRVSGKGQLAGDGFARQKAAIEAYAKAHGIRIVQWFEERGVCGATELDNRPALQDLLVALLADGVKLVLIEKLDRLARAVVVQESIIADFTRKGFEIRSVTEPDLCSDDPTRTLLRQMMGAFAEYERKMITLKLRAARQRMRARQGRCEGIKPYGFTTLEQATIERMKALRAQGLSLMRIAEQLHSEGLNPRSADAWQPATIARILKRQGATNEDRDLQMWAQHTQAL
jgi:DNA invertase Pin-like site-specific DNA recombinase